MIDSPVFIHQPSDPSFESTNWHNLKGVGFNVGVHMNMLVRDLEEAKRDGRVQSEVVDLWLERTDQELIAFKNEYLSKRPLFRFDFEDPEEAGYSALISKGYGKTLVDCVSEQEREGAVKRSVQAMSDFITQAPDNSVVVMTSPPGWSGLEDALDRSIHHQDTQTYIIAKNAQGKFEGVTVPTDMDFDENKELMIALGVSESEFTKSYTPRERLVDMVSHIATLSATPERSYGFDYVIEKIKEVKREKHANKIKVNGERVVVPFEDVYDELQHPENVQAWSENTKEIIQRFKDFVRSQPDLTSGFSQRRLTQEVSRTVLRMSKAVRSRGVETATLYYMTEEQFRQEFMYARTLSGCNGGGILDTIFGPRTIIKQEGYWRPGDCVACNNLHNPDKEVGPCKVCAYCEEQDKRTGNLSKVA